jgi:hypothetical protein
VTWRTWIEHEYGYPPDKGVRARMLPMPTARPERAAEPMTGRRRSDGKTVDIRRSLGLPSEAPPDEDQGVRWERWP